MFRKFELWDFYGVKNETKVFKKCARDSRSAAFYFGTFVHCDITRQSLITARSQTVFSQRQWESERVWVLEKIYIRKSADTTHTVYRLKSTKHSRVCPLTLSVTMCSASESVSNETEAAAWLDNISFCSGFCQWIDEELIDSLPADSQQPVESTRASEAEAVSAQPSAEKSPTGQIIKK